MVLRSLILAAIESVAHAAGVGKDSVLVPLNTGNFKSALLKEGRPPYMVMFHVDWCHVCQMTLPEYEKAYQQILKDGEGDHVIFAHVDLTNDKTLGTAFDIKGYPSIKWFPTDRKITEPFEFRSARGTDGFLNFVQRMTQPAILPLNTVDELETWWKKEQTTVFIQFGPEVHPDFDSAAKEIQDKHMFYHCNHTSPEDEFGELLGISGATEQIIAVTHGSRVVGKTIAYESIVVDGGANISDWVQTNRFPGTWILNGASFFDFTHAGKKAAILVFDPAKERPPNAPWYTENMRDAAKKHPDYYFGVLDGFDFKDALTGFSIFYEQLPRLLVVEETMPKTKLI
jgi:thiol-disulfide isomerase/thioredoxin